MTTDHPDSLIIDALGGTAATARLFHIAQPSVTKWRTTGIPPARLMYLQVARPELFIEKVNVEIISDVAYKRYVNKDI